jgi:hypothetical protein
MAQKIALGMTEGGIVEEVTNSNGTAVKFDTGLMVCYHTLTLTYNAVSNLKTTWTFPHAFLNDDVVIDPSFNGSLSAGSVTTTMLGAHFGNVLSSTQAEIFQNRVNGQTNFSSGNTCGSDVIAIGRWK